MSSRYQHTHLDLSLRQVRLLRIDKVTPGAACCSLSCFDFQQAPEYRALSYVWGESSPTIAIVLNGGRFDIRMNLGDFFKTAGDQWLGQWLWIDQLCIDQENIKERNQQVGMMAEIYRSAREVIVWLGTSPNPDQLTMTRLKGLIDAFKIRTVTDYVPKGTVALPAGYDFSKDLIETIYSNPYWRRLWIIQELILAQSICIHIGSHKIQWSDLEAIEELRCRQPKINFRGSISSLIRNRGSQTLTFEKALSVGSSNHCQDPRDHVYGILGMLSDPSGIEVDYRRSVEEVLIDTIKLCLARWSLASDSPKLRWIVLCCYDLAHSMLPHKLDSSIWGKDLDPIEDTADDVERLVQNYCNRDGKSGESGSIDIDEATLNKFRKRVLESFHAQIARSNT